VVRVPTVDCHVHLRDEADIEVFLGLGEQLSVVRMNLLSTPDPETVNDNPLVLLAKSRRPDFFHVFAGLDHSTAFSGERVRAPELAEQVDLLADLGADGVKLLDSKPTSRKHMDVPIDGDCYRGLFNRLEERGLPVLWHVADPEEFWDPQRTPGWAAERGWGYDESFVPKERLYAEVEAVLERHPRLKVIFPHFYFLSADLERAERFLADHPNVHLDLAPGIELFYNLSKNPALSREFFVDHADRILFGTDTGMTPRLPPETCRARVELVARFLETADEYRLPPEADFLLGPPEDGMVRGIDLPEDVLERICRANFERIAGGAPRQLDPALAAAECRRIAAEVDALAGGKADVNLAARVAEKFPS
jgi:predicted TIM-barrel fold metal-dependent hydrolase